MFACRHKKNKGWRFDRRSSHLEARDDDGICLIRSRYIHTHAVTSLLACLCVCVCVLADMLRVYCLSLRCSSTSPDLAVAFEFSARVVDQDPGSDDYDDESVVEV